MSLDKLTGHIKKNALKEAKKIEAMAQKEAEAIRLETKEQASDNKKRRLAQAEREASFAKDARLAKARLEAKNLMLVGRREYIEKAFVQALGQLNEEKGDDYTAIITDLLVNNSSGNEEVIMADSVATEIIEQANRRLSDKGKPGELKPSEDRIKKKGFVLQDDKGTRADFTFESLIEYFKEELEKEVHLILSGDQNEKK